MLPTPSPASPTKPDVPPRPAATVSFSGFPAGSGSGSSVQFDGLYGGTLGEGSFPTEIHPPAVAGYEILRELGRGGMGVVYLAREVALNRLVALKIMGGGAAGSAHELQRFRTEAEAVASLHHPNIVQIHAIGEANGWPFVSLEYVDGGTLAQQLHGQPIEPHEAARIIVTLAQTLNYAHRHGIVHRDLKPSNILVAGADEPDEPTGRRHSESTKLRLSAARLKVADFGLAKRLNTESGQTRTGVVVGTPEYMAPEQAAGKTKEIGPAADIFSLGAMLYELLTGRPPHRGLLPMDTLLQVIQEEPVRPSRLVPTLPKDLETICLKCLEKEPNRRYATAEALAADLRRFLSDQPIAARPIGRVERLLRWRRKNKLAAGALLAAALFLIGGTAAATTFAALAQKRAWEAEEARAATAVERRRAEQQYQFAREAVDSLLPLASELRSSQDLSRGREVALTISGTMYRRLFTAEPTNGELRFKLADTLLNHGLLANELLRPEDGAAKLKEAQEHFDGLAEEQVTHFEVRYQAASARLNLGKSARDRGQTGEQERLYREAFGLWEKMLGEFKEPGATSRSLESTHYAWAQELMELERWAEAASTLARAPGFPGRHPDGKEVGGVSAWSVFRAETALGHLALELGRLAEAEARLRRALAAHAAAIAESSVLATRVWESAASRLTLIRALAGQGKTVEAEAELRALFTLLAAPARSSTAAQLTKQALARAHRLRATLRAEQPAAARADLLTAIALCRELLTSSPQFTVRHTELAALLNDQGELELAQGEADKALSLFQEAEAACDKTRADALHLPTQREQLRGRMGQARALAKLKRPTEAASVRVEFPADRPVMGDLRLGWAKTLLEWNRPHEALAELKRFEAALRQALAAEAENPLHLKHAAAARALLGRYPGAAPETK